MNKKVIELSSFKRKEYLCHELNETMGQDFDATKAFMDLIEDIKIKSTQTKMPFVQLLEEESKRFLEGIYIEKSKQPHMIDFLTKNKITCYIIRKNRFCFIYYEDYKKVLSVLEKTRS